MAILRRKVGGDFIIKGQGATFYTLQLSSEGVQFLKERGINENNTVPRTYLRQLLTTRMAYTKGEAKSIQAQIDQWHTEDNQKADILINWGENSKGVGFKKARNALVKTLRMFQPQISAADIFTKGFIEHVFAGKRLFGVHQKILDRHAYNTLNLLKRIVKNADKTGGNEAINGVSFDTILRNILHDIENAVNNKKLRTDQQREIKKSNTPQIKLKKKKKNVWSPNGRKLFRCSKCNREVVSWYGKKTYKKKCPKCQAPDATFTYIRHARIVKKYKKNNRKYY